MDIRPFVPADVGSIIELWKKCGLVVPENDPWRDIQRKMHVDPELLLVGVEDDRVVATVMAGYEGHRGWINYAAVHPDYRRRGWGRDMMAAAEQALAKLNCPKINLQVRQSNQQVVDFYRALGYETDDVISLGKRLTQDKQDDPARDASP
ncbi:MAG: GNAT family acetyltransferase [Planctomycetota bacterium]